MLTIVSDSSRKNKCQESYYMTGTNVIQQWFSLSMFKLLVVWGCFVDSLEISEL